MTVTKTSKLPIFMGLDFGEKTIGVSISSLDGKVATGVTTIKRPDEATIRPALKQLKEIIREYGVRHIVLGEPKNLDGSESVRLTKTIAFKEKLQRYFKSVSVELWDERFSTQAVTRVFEGNRKQYKKNVDEMAAVYILQGYLDNRRYGIMTNEPMETGDDDIILYNDAGDEMPLQILASREDPTGMYILALEGDESDPEVAHFKLIPSDDEDVIFELVDEEHEDFDRVFELFKDDYESLGIELDDIEI